MKKLSATRWTVVLAAQAGDETAREELSSKYRPAVVSFLRRHAIDADEAEDVAQEVFLQLFAAALAGVDADKGRFRSLLFTMSRNQLIKHYERRTAQKRGGGKVRLLGDMDPGASEPDEASFDREWLANLLRGALERLSKEHPNYFRALQGFLMQGKTQAQIADELGVTVGVVKKHVFRGKQKLIGYLREEVWHVSRSVGEYEDELRTLSRLLAR